MKKKAAEKGKQTTAKPKGNSELTFIRCRLGDAIPGK